MTIVTETVSFNAFKINSQHCLGRDLPDWIKVEDEEWHRNPMCRILLHNVGDWLLKMPNGDIITYPDWHMQQFLETVQGNV